jgi:hypothetical protein
MSGTPRGVVPYGNLFIVARRGCPLWHTAQDANPRAIGESAPTEELGRVKKSS